MPSKVFIKLKLQQPVKGTDIKPDLLHGLFFNLLDPQTAEKLHYEYGNVKPYSLFSRELFKEETFNEVSLEINLLEDRLLPPLLSCLLLERDKNLFLGKVGVEKFSVIGLREENVIPYGEIFEKTQDSDKVLVKFLKPTTFRRNRVDLPFPLPELIFKGLVKKWNAFSSLPLDVDLREYYPYVKVSKYSLKSYKVEFSNGGKLTAFLGYALFSFDEVKDREAKRWFLTLLNFARFCGIGRKTTMGLGKVSFKLLEREQ